MLEEDNFARALNEALTQEYVESIPKGETHEFSRGFERRMAKLIKRREKPYYRFINTLGKRVACMVALGVMISTITVMSVSALREKVFNFFVTTFQKFSTVQYDSRSDGNESPASIERLYSIGGDYLADYEIDYEYTDDTVHDVVYCNGDTVINFSQYVKDSFDIDYNTEDTQIETISINGWDGIYFLDNQGYSDVVLDAGDYIISVCANVPKSRLVDIVNTVGYVE